MPSPADAAPSWVWVADLPEPGGSVVLDREEGHHVVRVCRARVGDTLTLTDGKGALGRALLSQVKPRALAEVTSRTHAARPREATLLCGAPEGERGDWLVEKLGELGIAVFQPVDCERGRWRRAASRAARWRRLALAALRQSRRSHLLEVRDPEPLREALGRLEGHAERWMADPSGRAAGEVRPPRGASVGVVGPGPGLSDREAEVLQAWGFERIRLSNGVLRSETAAMAWASWWAGGDP